MLILKSSTIRVLAPDLYHCAMMKSEKRTCTRNSTQTEMAAREKKQKDRSKECLQNIGL